MILISRRISSRYGLRGVRVGEATHMGPPRIRVLLDPASQWSEVPTTVVATSREVDTPTNLPRPLQSHQQAKLREFWARTSLPQSLQVKMMLFRRATTVRDPV